MPPTYLYLRNKWERKQRLRTTKPTAKLIHCNCILGFNGQIFDYLVTNEMTTGLKSNPNAKLTDQSGPLNWMHISMNYQKQLSILNNVNNLRSDATDVCSKNSLEIYAFYYLG